MPNELKDACVRRDRLVSECVNEQKQVIKVPNGDILPGDEDISEWLYKEEYMR